MGVGPVDGDVFQGLKWREKVSGQDKAPSLVAGTRLADSFRMLPVPSWCVCQGPSSY